MSPITSTTSTLSTKPGQLLIGKKLLSKLPADASANLLAKAISQDQFYIIIALPDYQTHTAKFGPLPSLRSVSAPHKVPLLPPSSTSVAHAVPPPNPSTRKPVTTEDLVKAGLLKPRAESEQIRIKQICQGNPETKTDKCEFYTPGQGCEKLSKCQACLEKQWLYPNARCPKEKW